MTDTLAATAQIAGDESGPDEAPRVPTERERYRALLRDLDRILGEHPEIPQPRIDGSIRFGIWVGDVPQLVAAIRRAIGGKWDKRPRDNEYGAYFDYVTEWHGFPVAVVTSRDEVCRKVVTGTRTVTRTVPDPEALAKVPMVEVTEDVEDFEWVCEPVLAPRPLAGEAPEAIEGTEAA
jgi:hypothetical protein